MPSLDRKRQLETSRDPSHPLCCARTHLLCTWTRNAYAMSSSVGVWGCRLRRAGTTTEPSPMLFARLFPSGRWLQSLGMRVPNHLRNDASIVHGVIPALVRVPKPVDLVCRVSGRTHCLEAILSGLWFARPIRTFYQPQANSERRIGTRTGSKNPQEH